MKIGGKTNKSDDLDVMGDGHHMNSSEAVGLGRDIWSRTGSREGSTTQPTFAFDENKLKEALQNAKNKEV